MHLIPSIKTQIYLQDICHYYRHINIDESNYIQKVVYFPREVLLHARGTLIIINQFSLAIHQI